jgi:threonine synthase
MQEIAREEGIFASPEGAAPWPAYKKLVQSGFLKPEDKVVLFSCGSGFKNTELFELPQLPVLDPNDPDIARQIL